MMKKILLSLGVIGAFLGYSIHERNESAKIHLSLPNNPSVSSTPTESSTPSSAAGSTPQTTATTAPAATTNKYKDGTFVGDPADAYYGNIQVQAVIQNGKITDVQFLQSPGDRGQSIEINSQAMPLLKQEAIQIQGAQVDVVSGATDSSQAFVQSMQSALDKAKS